MSELDRRGFIAAASVAGTAMAMTAKSYANVLGSNGKINVGFLGVGGRCQQHIDVVLDMKEEGKDVEPFAVCDVWDGDETLGNRSNPKHKDKRKGARPLSFGQDLRHRCQRQDPCDEGLSQNPRK